MIKVGIRHDDKGKLIPNPPPGSKCDSEWDIAFTTETNCSDGRNIKCPITILNPGFKFNPKSLTITEATVTPTPVP